MPPVSERDAQEALAALERLLRHDVVTLEEARLAARLVTGRDDLEFPPPAPPASEPAAAAAPPEAGTPPEQPPP